jgi:hypothetical protein
MLKQKLSLTLIHALLTAPLLSASIVFGAATFTLLQFSQPVSAQTISCGDGTSVDDPAKSLGPDAESQSNADRDASRETACAGKGGYESQNPNRLDNEVFDDELDVDCETKNPGEELNKDNCAIVSYLVTGINVLSALAGMAIIFSIMFAGFQYMTAQDNSGQIQQARQRIIWAITAMLIFIFMYAVLNFLVPGGVL